MYRCLSSDGDDSDNDCINSIISKDDNDDSMDNGPTPAKKRRRINNVWGLIEQESILDKQLNQIGMNQLVADREIESYIQHENESDKPSEQTKKNCGRKRKHNQPIQERLAPRNWDRSKPRDHVKSTIDSDPADVVHEISTLLEERKIELIERCVSILGIQKTLDLYFITEDIEESGGLMTLNGNRRRTPGGVFLNILRSSSDIPKDNIKKIFEFEERKKKKNKKARQKERKIKDEFELLLEQRKREILLEKTSVNEMKDIVSPDISLEAGELPLTNHKEDSLEEGEIPL